MTFERILVALDPVASGREVFERSLALGQACQGRLHLFHCLSLAALGEPAAPPLATAVLGLGTYPGFVNHLSWPQQVRARAEQAIAWLQDYCSLAAQQQVAVEFSYCLGEPGRSVCELARSWEADLIVMGRRGRRGLTAALLGSVSNYVVHHAPCSVLVIQTADPAGELAIAATAS